MQYPSAAVYTAKELREKRPDRDAFLCYQKNEATLVLSAVMLLYLESLYTCCAVNLKKGHLVVRIAEIPFCFNIHCNYNKHQANANNVTEV